MLIVGDPALYQLMLGILALLCLYWVVKFIASIFTGG